MINFVVRSRKNFKLDKKQYFPTIAASVPYAGAIFGVAVSVSARHGGVRKV